MAELFLASVGFGLQSLDFLCKAARAMSTVVHNIEKYRDLGPRLYDLQAELHACTIRLEKWRKDWGVRRRQSIRNLESLWGKQGWNNILTTIEASCEALNKDIRKTFDLPKDLDAGGEEILSMTYAIKDLADKSRKLRKSMRFGSKFGAAMLGKVDKLEDQLRNLHRRIQRLNEDSKLYLLVVHPNQHLEDLFPGQVLERWPVETAIAKQQQESAQELYDAVKEEGGLECWHLDLRLDNSDNSDYGYFEFYVSKESEKNELVIEYNVSCNASIRAEQAANLAEALRDKLKTADTVLVRVGAAIKAKEFLLKKSMAPWMDTVVDTPSLRERIDGPVSVDHDILRASFSRAERFQIIHVLAETSFRLLPTEWLSYFSTAGLHGTVSGAGSWAGKSMYQTASTDIGTRLQLIFHDSRIIDEAFRRLPLFGLTLWEVLRGQLCTEISKNSQGNIVFHIKVRGGERELLLEDCLNEVEDDWGMTYRDILKFCLQHIDGDFWTGSADFSIDYYQKVLIL
ncbi:hypothetical protein K469DRAFT_811228 [Zopfia rhizophila CBS 207.26]|uniref:Uncharacterized protein n=1 Tax=Zopfia rhizophila CBS 207.26 TaxID=1314779 RepID=A0A6A6EH92_9PEZI|nr:hypothetical protein K469DRAFT_811228 [Zopfia rhizophila CBS 207.26]